MLTHFMLAQAKLQDLEREQLWLRHLTEARSFRRSVHAPVAIRADLTRPTFRKVAR